MTEWHPREEAWQRARSFARRFGEPHVRLAMHAAVPIGLTPELLHLIRVNFVPGIPWVAEADLLLSPICRDVGGGFFEIDEELRRLLIEELQRDPEFGPARLSLIADFLGAWAERVRVAEPSRDPEWCDFVEGQSLTALSFQSPERAAQALATSLSSAARGGGADARVIKLTQGLSAALMSQVEIVTYAVALGKLNEGDVEGAMEHFSVLGPEDQPVKIGNITLPAPVELGKEERREDAQASLKVDGPARKRSVAGVFISYCHEDDFVWIEQFKNDLYTVLIRKLRARTKPEIFFDAHDLRAGRLFDADIPAFLSQTGVFVAMVSRPYNRSTYCRQKELMEFLRYQPPESGRLIQVQMDLSAMIPVNRALAVPFADAKGIFRADTDEYRDALRRVSEPIVQELDRLFAESKIVFLAWPSDPQLEEDRKRLESEIEGRGLRVFPEVVASYESDVRLRDALEQCTTSVHFFGHNPNPFDLRQWDMAVQLNRPCVIASRSATEERRGPAGSPAPIYLDQGNPTITIAKAIEQIIGIGNWEERAAQRSLGRTPVFLVFEPTTDAVLGLKIRKRIISRGPFEVIVPPNDTRTRYEDLSRAKAAVLCRAKASRTWLEFEVEALNRAMAASQRFDVRRALLLPSSDDVAGLNTLDGDLVLHSEEALDSFLSQLQGATT